MLGGKNRILPKEMNANRFFWVSHWLEIWSNYFCPSMGPNGGSVAMDSDPSKNTSNEPANCWKYKFLSVYSPFFLLILRIRVKNLNVYGEYAEVFNRIRRILPKYFNVGLFPVHKFVSRVFKLIRRIRKIYGKKAKKFLPYSSNSLRDIKLSLPWRFLLPRPKIF